MKMPKEILTRLLKGEHFNVPQRKELGVWPSEQLSYKEVLQHLTILLHNSEWFPFDPPPDFKSERIFINKVSDTKYISHCRHAHAIDPNWWDEDIQHIFKSAQDAAEFFLKWDLHLPGDLDSWPVI